MSILPQRGRGRPHTTNPEIRTTVITSDHHLPLINTASYRAVLNFIKDKRPDYHFLAGDILDCHDQSSFIKDPEQTGRTAESIDMANEMLNELAEVSPNTITKIVFGNHSHRLTKRLWENPDLLEFLSGRGKTPYHLLAEALSLQDRGIDWWPYHTRVNHFGFLISHGEYTNTHPAKKEVESAGLPGVSGHVHRQTMWEQKNGRGVAHWYSIGGLCDTEMSYRPVNTWVNGFGFLEQVVNTDTYTFHQLPIVRGQFIFNSRLYTQDGVFDSV